MGADQSTEVITFAGCGVDGPPKPSRVGTDAVIGYPTGIAVDFEHAVYVCDPKHHVIWKILPETGEAIVLAGKADAPDYADAATGELARFHTPSAIYTSADRKMLFVCDTGNGRVRQMTPGGSVTTLAGDGTMKAIDTETADTISAGGGGAGGAGGSDEKKQSPASSKQATSSMGGFYRVTNGCVDAYGNHFLIDGHSIRKIWTRTVPKDVVGLTEANAPVSTTAGGAGGSGSGSSTGGSGGGAASTESLLASNTADSDSSSAHRHSIELDALTGKPKLRLTTVCGVATERGHADVDDKAADLAGARFGDLRGITCDGLSNLYVSEADTHTIRRIGRAFSRTNNTSEKMIVSTAGGVYSGSRSGGGGGSGGGAAAASGGFVDGKVVAVTRTTDPVTGAETETESPYARFHTPTSLAFDYEWSLFIADELNHKIRRITQDYFVTTHAGSERGFADGTLIDSKFNEPCGLALDYSRGVMYVCDRGNSRIRRVKLPLGNACRACEEGQFCTIQ